MARRRGVTVNANQTVGGQRVVSSLTNRSTGVTQVRLENGQRATIAPTSGGTGG